MPSVNPRADLAVVIVSYNVEGLLRKCLATLRGRLPAGNNAVVVVDNVSKDNSAEMVRREFPECAVLRQERNTGFGRATNAGARTVDADYYLILNPDTEITNDIIVRLAEHLKRHPEAGIAGCRMKSPDGTEQRFVYALPGLFSALSSILQLKKLLEIELLARLLGGLTCVPALRDYLRPREWSGDWARVGAVPGSCFLADGRLWRELGGFDENIFLYSEDSDLFYRVRHQAKKEIHLLKETGVIHHVGKSFSPRFTEVSPYKYWSTLYYFRKNHGPLSYAAVAAALFAAAAVRLAAALLRGAGDEREKKYRRDCLLLIKMAVFGLGAFDPFPSSD